MQEFLSHWYGLLTVIAGSVIIFLLLSVLLYKPFFKRFYDIVLSGLALLILSPVYLILAILVRTKLGRPVIFVQKRPGKKNKIFKLHKFRTMTNARDDDGNLLPDEQRMTKFGKFLRSTSLDELPEIWDIFRGKMSIIGPRPQLVKDLVFMSDEIKRRHSLRPGLTGLAQVKGRNNIDWDERFKYDLYYVRKLSFFLDLKIFLLTILKVFKRADVSTEGMETSEDYGDWLLGNERITEEQFNAGIYEYKTIRFDANNENVVITPKKQSLDINSSNFSILMSVYKNSKKDELQECLDSVLNQTVKSNEIVIVIDGSIPVDLLNYLNDIAKIHNEIKLCHLSENAGLGKALAFGLSNCTNELIARMDTDDICTHDRFEKQLKCFNSDSYLSIVGSNIAEFIDSKENVVSYRNVPSTHKEICDFLKKRCPFNHMTVMFKKSEVERSGGYLHWHYDEDSYLWVRMYLAGCKFQNLPENLVFARIDKNTFTRRGGYKYYKSERNLFKLMKKHEIISFCEYQKAKIIRFVVQVFMPNKMRQWFFIRFARKTINAETVSD